jgi:CheY-like chemotaxis protein
MANELVLIVEDNEKNRKLVRDVLHFKAYRLAEAETGEEDVRLARELRPELNRPGSCRSAVTPLMPGSWMSIKTRPRRFRRSP